jgi:putative tryptophan/tyrosine transport system substrate-binding protein
VSDITPFEPKSYANLGAVLDCYVPADASGLVVVADPSLLTYRDQLIALSARDAIATIYPLPDFPAAGGLMSYGVNMTDGHDLVGGYTARR